MEERKKYFEIEEDPFEHYYLISYNSEFMPLSGLRGSYNVIQARIMGLSWAQFLRFCRDILKAELVGKNGLYPAIRFKDKTLVSEYVRTLNLRMAMIMWERNHPNWKDNLEELVRYENMMEAKYGSLKEKNR